MATAMTALILAMLALICTPAAASADTDGPQVAVHGFLLDQAGSLGEQVEIEVHGPVARFDDCESPRPFLPTHPEPLWGRVSVGVRCDNGPVRYITAEIRVYGHYLIAARDLPAGTRLQPGMITSTRGELNRLPATAVRDSADVIGLETRHRLAKGAILQSRQLRRPALVERGETVEISAGGPGFRASLQGEALDSGGTGEAVRVRIDRRRIVEARVTGPGKLAITPGGD